MRVKPEQASKWKSWTPTQPDDGEGSTNRGSSRQMHPDRSIGVVGTARWDRGSGKRERPVLDGGSGLNDASAPSRVNFRGLCVSSSLARRGAQRGREFRTAFRRPHQRAHWIAHRHRFHQLAQAFQQRWICRDQRWAATTRPPNLTGQRAWVGQVLQPPAYRAASDPRCLGRRRNPAASGRSGLRRRKQAARPFVQVPFNRREPFANH